MYYADNNTCVSETDLVRIKQLLELMFIGGVSVDREGRLINGSRWNYETSIFVSIELLATVGMLHAPTAFCGEERGWIGA